MNKKDPLSNGVMSKKKGMNFRPKLEQDEPCNKLSKTNNVLSSGYETVNTHALLHLELSFAILNFHSGLLQCH